MIPAAVVFFAEDDDGETITKTLKKSLPKNCPVYGCISRALTSNVMSRSKLQIMVIPRSSKIKVHASLISVYFIKTIVFACVCVLCNLLLDWVPVDLCTFHNIFGFAGA